VSAAGRSWIRRGSTALIIGFLVTVAVIGYQRTQRNGDGVESLDAGTVGFDARDIAIGLYKGFGYTETLDGRTIFILNSLRTLSLASGWQEIEGVRLQFFREGEPGPILTAERASFNIETKDARLEGGIHVEFPNGAFLNTEAGGFQSKRQAFVSDAPVLYVDGATIGQAERASYSFDDNWVKLEGNAALRSDDGAMLVAPEMVYRRDDRRVVFSEGLELTQAMTRLTAPRALVWLASDGGPPEKFELTGGVDMTTTVETTGALVTMWSERVVSRRDVQGQWQLKAQTTGPWVEIRFTGGPDYFERTLRTLDLSAVFGEQGIISMRADDGVCIDEIPMEGPRRMASAESARAWFDDGQLTDVELNGHVEIQTADFVGRGIRARLVQSTGLVMLQGDPTGRSRVALDSDQGQMSCDQATLYDREGRIEARGQVHGELRNARLLGSGLQTADNETFRFAGEVLQVEDDGDRFSLRENARIWQGRRLLMADDVQYRNRAQSVEARGHVRVSFPADEKDSTGSADDELVVDARSLNYDALEGLAVFRGSVHYADPKHSLSANRLSITFAEDDSISDVEAEGAVEIRDLGMGRTLTGKHALREVKSQVITVTGSPAQLTDERGNVASGDSLTWNQADGTVSIDGGTELIYYPEEQP